MVTRTRIVSGSFIGCLTIVSVGNNEPTAVPATLHVAHSFLYWRIWAVPAPAQNDQLVSITFLFVTLLMFQFSGE